MSILDMVKPHMQNISIFQWARLGICFGLFFWMRQAVMFIIAGRAIEKMLTVYQLATIMEENDIVLDELVYNVYGETFQFEALLIIAVSYFLFLKFVLWFGCKDKLVDFQKVKNVIGEI